LQIAPGCALLSSVDTEVGPPRTPGRERPHAKERAIPAKVFVGNLSFQTTKERLQEFLAGAGTILDCALPTDRETGRPRGFAFVEFSSDAEAAACIEKFNGQELDGRALRINSAEDRPRRAGGFGAPRGGGPMDGGEPFFGGHRPFKSKGSRRGLRARKRGG
jgi:RNA recognition motif-containing protein